MKLTRQQAINEKCKDCIYDSSNGGTWREQTENCTSLDCALYEYRPVTASLSKKRQQEKINSMSETERTAYEARAEKARKRLLGTKVGFK